jgi:hypothetical protein
MTRRNLFPALLGLVGATAATATVSKGILDKRVEEEFKGDGQTKAFALSYVPTANEEVDVYLNGVEQSEGRDYTLAGKTLTMVRTAAAGDFIDVKYRAVFTV